MITPQMMDAISNYDYEQPADAPSVDDFTQGADNGLKLTDMIDVDYDDDETWNKFLDQLTVEQLCNTVTDSKSTNTISTLDVPGNTKGDDDTNAAGGAIQFVSHPLTARTWNTDMNEKRGLYEGLICTLNGKDEIWYGAGNLHRHPYGGRAGQYWSEDATLDEVVAAAKAAHADSFIRRLPDGYDTVIAEDGGNISQGQKQLLCIARVMLCLPPMLILDEATSSIDTRTEVRIQKAFARMMQGRTSFIVAHRLSTIREADVILVMKDGHIVEQGNHDELLAAGGFYAKLYNSQFEGVET